MLLPSEEGVQFFFPESLAGKAPRPTEPVVVLRLVLGGKKVGKGPKPNLGSLLHHRQILPMNLPNYFRPADGFWTDREALSYGTKMIV
jgi:hypothetical protein